MLSANLLMHKYDLVFRDITRSYNNPQTPPTHTAQVRLLHSFRPTLAALAKRPPQKGLTTLDIDSAALWAAILDQRRGTDRGRGLEPDS